MNKLSKRLNTIINLCEKFDVYADIGCDHGYVTYELLNQEKAKKVYAIDIHKESLEKTKQLLLKNNLIHKAELMVADGFSQIKAQEIKTIQCAVIAGMGGQEIIKVLQEYQPQHLILQPMKNSYDLRKFLVNNNYFIKKDFIMREKDKYYEIISCFKGQKQNLTQLELIFGKDNFNNNKDFINYLMMLKNKYEIINNNHQNSKAQNILQNIQNALKLMQGSNNND